MIDLTYQLHPLMNHVIMLTLYKYQFAAYDERHIPYQKYRVPCTSAYFTLCAVLDNDYLNQVWLYLVV